MNKNPDIVLAERDRISQLGLNTLLTQEGFSVRVAAERTLARALCQRTLPDMAIIETHLGGESEAGFLLCRELRSLSPGLPIIILGDGDSDIDRITSYRLGADDYVNRKRDPRVLICRIHTLLQRVADCAATPRSMPVRYCDGRLRLDRQRHQVYWDGHRVELTVAQFRMVRTLVESNGEVRSLAELTRAAEIQVQPNTVTATIARIRKQFRSIDRGFDAIRNAHGRGYLWLV